MIPIGKFGFIILNVELSPSLVDSNVHPAKLEVRFQEEQKVFKAVYCAIQDTLLKTELIANTGVSEKNDNLEEGNMGDEEQETKSSLSGLFRRIAKNANEEENNLIESIYKSKNGGHDIEEDELEVDIKQNDMQNLGVVQSATTYDESNNQFQKVESPKNLNVDAQSQDAIKNTINEFMQMGKSLTAEQIREKLSKLAAQNTVINSPKISDNQKTNDNENKQNDRKQYKDINTNQNYGIGEYSNNMERVPQNDSTKLEEVAKKDIFEETFGNFTLIKPKVANITPEKNIEEKRLNFSDNMVLENKEKYEPKVVEYESNEKGSKENIDNNSQEERTKTRRYIIKYFTRKR